MYSLVAPRELLTVTSGYCSLIEGCAGFAVYLMGVGGFGYKIQGPAGVFTAELSAVFTALRHIGYMLRLYGTIKAMMSRKIAHQTHPVVYECKQLC
jgi:hypothetical protein